MNTATAEKSVLDYLKDKDTFFNLSVPELIERALKNHEGFLTDHGALAVNTGKYTGRSPKDKFFVKDSLTSARIDWLRNRPINESAFNNLFKKMIRYLNQAPCRYLFKGFSGNASENKLGLKIVTELAWENIYCRQMFMAADEKKPRQAAAEFTLLVAPGFKADPAIDGTHSEAFILINLTRRMILIGGTQYGGEIKKSVFTVLNFLLPQKDILSMHCSANQDASGRATLFFGLSGTGKTTLSNAPGRRLIGDDEHGWSNEGIHNLEGGCYAKAIRISPLEQPQICQSIQFGTILENVIIHYDDRTPDYMNDRLTENTRAAFTLENVPNAEITGTGNHPDTLIFLTADAFGVLPPISILTPEQAIYQFLSGYTSKTPGTERGIKEPQATFSTCFGSPFMPLRPSVYANLLYRQIKEYKATTYLVNTGWCGGRYGTGKRIALEKTRRIINAVQTGELLKSAIVADPLFGLRIPKDCADISEKLLLPWKAWNDKQAYRQTAMQLIQKFQDNFSQFPDVPTEIQQAGPTFR